MSYARISAAVKNIIIIVITKKNDRERPRYIIIISYYLLLPVKRFPLINANIIIAIPVYIHVRLAWSINLFSTTIIYYYCNILRILVLHRKYVHREFHFSVFPSTKDLSHHYKYIVAYTA